MSVLCSQFNGHVSRIKLAPTSSSTPGDVIREKRALHPQIVEPAEKLIDNGFKLSLKLLKKHILLITLSIIY